MTSSPFRFGVTCCFALGGLIFAAWLALFFHDGNRPVPPQERADRLAADNYRDWSLSAPVPPSPAHWAQRQVWQDPATGARHPVAREDAALTIAIAGGNPRLAGALACGFATAALGWLALGIASLPRSLAVGLTAAIVLSVTHGLAWQMTDPAPFLFLGASSLAVGAWLRYRAQPRKRIAWLAGIGLAGMSVQGAAPALLLSAMMAIDLLALKRGDPRPIPAHPRPGLWCAAIAPVLLTALLGLKNLGSTGSLLESPAQAYTTSATTAPRWFWEQTRVPQDSLDPVLERYDELVAIPQTRWETPVYQTWLKRMIDGAFLSGGLALAILGLGAALAIPAKDARPAWLIVAGVSILALLRHDVPRSWWTLLSPAWLILNALGAVRLAAAPALARRTLVLAGLFHAALLAMAPQATDTDAEYVFSKRIKDVTKKLLEQPGPHLVFVSLDNACDGRLEPGDLPRDWSKSPVLFARDLGPEKNAALVASMPDYKPSLIKVLPGGIGLKPWKAETAPQAADTPEGAPAATESTR